MHALSPVVTMYEALRGFDAGWRVELGRPTGTGWMPGDALRDAASGPLNDLLERIGTRARIDDRRTIAGSFTVRFGWSSAMAIAPYVRCRCVPDVSLANIALRFSAAASLDGTAVLEARGIVIAGDARAGHPSMTTVPDDHSLLRALRDALVAQAAPMVKTVCAWSGFAERAIWGTLTASWASHFMSFWPRGDDQRELVSVLDAFFTGGDMVAEMRPAIRAVGDGEGAHLRQRRASCCRFYLYPGGSLCTSCPLLPDDGQVARDRRWV